MGSRVPVSRLIGQLSLALQLLYFSVAFVEILAEYFHWPSMIWCTKPLLMPLLALLYAVTSDKRSVLFLLALAFTWGGNLFFISSDFDSIIAGVVLFTAYRALCIVIVLRQVRLPGVLPLLIGALPFLFLYLFVVNMTYDELQEGLWLFLLQGVFMVIYGGLSLGSYAFNPNKTNTYLIIGTLLFTFTQFLFVIKLFFVQTDVFQPLSMALYVAAQYLFYKFMRAYEKSS